MASFSRKRKFFEPNSRELYRNGGGPTCSVIGCRKNRRDLYLWSIRECFDHKPQVHGECGCPPPFQLHSPKNPDERREWLSKLNLKNPPANIFVCTFHFIDRMPTVENPLPQLYLGYDLPPKRGRKQRTKGGTKPRQETVPGHKIRKCSENSSPTDNATYSDCDKNEENQGVPDTSPEPDTSHPQPQNPQKRDAETQWIDPTHEQYCKKLPLHEVLGTFTQTPPPPSRCNHGTQCQIADDLGQSSYLVQTDNDATLYAGIALDKFQALVEAMKPVAQSFQLHLSDQILMVLMKIRLNLLLEHLSRRFSVSVEQCSKIISFWIAKLAEQLAPLVTWLPRETIRATMPECFKRKYPKTTVIIDCAETIMQKAQNLDSRGETYSTYKSHNTAKYLVGIAPSGLIMFILRAYEGRASDKFIVQDSGLLDYLDPGDEVMADRGFTIEDWVFQHQAKLNIPAFSHGSQLTEEEVTTTRHLASVRIHVERAIRRLKVFKMLRDIVPISMSGKIDCILRICAALVNLRGDLIKDADVITDQEDSVEKDVATDQADSVDQKSSGETA